MSRRREDALAEAFAGALADWPKNGIPSNPEAWLLTAARRRAIDAARRKQSAALGEGHLTLMAEEMEQANIRASRRQSPTAASP